MLHPMGRAFPERLALAKARIARNERRAALLDPFPLDLDLSKYRHQFAIGDRVRIANPEYAHQTGGHVGRITETSGSHDWLVELDSGDRVHVCDSEILPEHFAVPETDDGDYPEAKFVKFGNKRVTLSLGADRKIHVRVTKE